jgi:hypothetical protein
MLETAIFWVRVLGIVLTILGMIAFAVSGYLGSRLAAERASQAEELRRQMLVMEERYTRDLEEARRPKPGEMRALSLDEHRALVTALQPLAGQRVVVVSAQEWEPANYAHQIIKSLRTAGLDVRVTYYPENGEVPEGVEAVWMNEGERIVSALNKAGVDLRSTRGTPRGEAALELHIGRKAEQRQAAPAATR